MRDLLGQLPASTERVYLCAPGGTLPEAPQVGQSSNTPVDMYSPFHSWLLEGEPDSYYLKSGAEHSETLARYAREQGMRPVMVRPIASWVDMNGCTPEQAHAALKVVQERLHRQQSWGEAPLLETPAATGLDLWRRAIGFDVSYELLPDDLRALIHATDGQGRFEVFGPLHEGATLPALHCLDGRWMYAAPCLEELGVGPVVHDHLPDYAGYQPARYRVRFEVPPDWAHAGLLMVKADNRREGWHFPATPGYSGETWADAAELRVALNPFPHACQTCAAGHHDNAGPVPRPCPEHGWRITIAERLIFTTGRPLHTWTRKLEEVRAACSGPEGDALASAAVRNLHIHALGAFHSTSREIQHSAGEDERDRIPDYAPAGTLQMADGSERYVWRERRRRNPDPHYDRPELPAQVWGRARARLLLHRSYDGSFTGALTLPRETLAAFQQDAIYTTANPGWIDDGRVGRLRTKGRPLSGPLPWPQSQAALDALKCEMKGGSA